MGKCILTFDQIEILAKMSDSDHSDNDWLFITWFVKNQLVRTDKIPLVNQSGSRILDSGDHLLPVLSEVACEDTDPVTAAFVVMNLGSYDWNEQIEAAGKIASKFAEGAAEAYLTAVKFVLENLGQVGANPIVSAFAKFVAAHWNEFAPAIKDSVGAFIEDALIPLFEEIVAGVLLILGRPNCNGPVFHDIAVFKNPVWPEPPLTMWNVYTADSNAGSATARTSVHYTLDRDLDFVPQFPNTQPPQYGFVPSVNESPDNWLGDWVNDNFSPPPLIYVTIARSLISSGLYSITIREDIDRRFNIVFATKADPIAPRSDLLLSPYKDNVQANVQPWSSHPVAPGPLQVFAAKLSPAFSSSSVASWSFLSEEKPEPMSLLIAMPYKRPFTGGTPLTVAKGAYAEAFVPGGMDSSLFFEVADGFRFKDRDITLAFYNVVANGQVVARALRYLRGATPAFTRADWMLVEWKKPI